MYRQAASARKHAAEDKLLMGGSAEQDWKDADFIAASRTDVPALLDALEIAVKALGKLVDEGYDVDTYAESVLAKIEERLK